MQCLVLGHSGQVASAIRLRFGENGLRVTALGRADLDLADPVAAREAILSAAPDVVINAAAYTAVDRAETDAAAAFALNSTGPAAAAAAAAEVGAPFIHFSTDYVFDGARGQPYSESDPTFPLGVYGRSKLEGEEAVADANAEHIILRTSWVCSPTGANFLRTMLRLAAEREEIGVVDDQYGNPTFAYDLAAATEVIVQRIGRDRRGTPWGVYHLTGAGDTTWCGFARAIMEGAAARGGPSARVKAITTADYPTPVRRPVDSRLSCAKIEKAFGIEPRQWRGALLQALDEIYGNEERRA